MMELGDFGGAWGLDKIGVVAPEMVSEWVAASSNLAPV